MALREEYERVGHFLFKYRSYIPLFLLPLFIGFYYTQRDNAGYYLHDTTFIIASIAVCVLGLAIRASAVGYASPNTSGRNINSQRADHLNTTGLYSVMRHPLYLGNVLMWIGLSLRAKSLWLTAVNILFFSLYYEKIIYTEEEFLRSKFGSTFEEWANKTPLFPIHWGLWQPNTNPFLWKKVFRKEQDTFYAFAVCVCFPEFFYFAICKLQFSLTSWWVCFIVASTLCYLALKVMKKKTKWLNE